MINQTNLFQTLISNGEKIFFTKIIFVNLCNEWDNDGTFLTDNLQSEEALIYTTASN